MCSWVRILERRRSGEHEEADSDNREVTTCQVSNEIGR